MPSIRTRFPFSPYLILTLSFAAAFIAAVAQAAPKKPQYLPPKEAFAELEPLVVKGDELSITVFARDSSDRSYAERFALPPVEAAYHTIEKSTGRGLVIVGDKGEPHPVLVFRSVLELAESGKLGPEYQAATAELSKLIADWQAKLSFGDDSEAQSILDPDQVLAALPVPLQGIAAKLFLLAWNEQFDQARLEAQLASLTPTQLEADAFATYDWVFYLPPKSALRQVVKEAVPKAMKQADLGFFKRAAIRTALATFRPLVDDALESLRKGMLYFTVIKARSDLDEETTNVFMEAYFSAIMPRGKIIGGDKQDRAIAAIDEQKLKNIEYAKNPWVAPTPLENPDFNHYAAFAGSYGSNPKKPTHRFFIEDGACRWHYLKGKPGIFLPAGDNLLVSEKGDMTIEFILGPDGSVEAVQESWKRRQYRIPAPKKKR